MPLETSFDELRTRHHAILFDAYGVLVDASGARPGAVEAIALLNRTGQAFLVVTNDASRSAERAAARFARLGLEVGPEQILSSGMMIAPAILESGSANLRVVVLGTRDSVAYAQSAGVQIVQPSVANPADLVVVADEGGFDTLPIMDETLSMIIAAVRRGTTPRLLLANPDLIYPSSAESFGFTAGSLALMIERALQVVLGDTAPTFEILGKPSPDIFMKAINRLGTRDAVMVGDQLHTDVAGAHSVGMASALLLGGVSDARARPEWKQWTPTYVLRSL